MFEQDIFDSSHGDNKCKELIEKFLTICLPVKIKPEVEVKQIKTECCGKAIIVPGRGCCHKCDEDGSCEFTIVQKMKIEIPVEFKTKTEINKPFVDCEFKKDEDKNCDEEKNDNKCQECANNKCDDKCKQPEKDFCKIKDY